MSSASQLSISIEGDWARLIQTHQHNVWRYLRSLGCTPAQADDLTQETFLRVMERPFEQIDPRATAAYLRKVAYSRFITYCRRQAKTVELDGLETVDTYWAEQLDGNQTDDLVDFLRACLEQLTQRARTALDLRYGQQATRRRIAEALNMTEHGAKNLLQRAKKKLRVCVEQKQLAAGQPSRGSDPQGRQET